MNKNIFMKTIIVLIFIFLNLTCETLNKNLDEEIEENWWGHENAEWSPDGQKIAFVAQIDGVHGIYIIDTNGTNLKLAISAPTYSVTWSPDGQWFATSLRGSLYKVKVDGDSLTRLTVSDQDFDPNWSYDGKFISYTKTICDPECGVMILSPNNGKPSLVKQYGGYPTWDSTSKNVFSLTTNWTSKGYKIGYTIWVTDIDSLRSNKLLSFETKDYCQNIDLNRAGTEIVYHRKKDGKYTQVWKININSDQQTQLTFDGGAKPAWSPDGKKIAYTRTYKNDGGLWIMNYDGSNKKRLTQPKR